MTVVSALAANAGGFGPLCPDSAPLKLRVGGGVQEENHCLMEALPPEGVINGSGQPGSPATALPARRTR